MLKNQIGNIAPRYKNGAIVTTKPLFKKGSGCRTTQTLAYEMAKNYFKEYGNYEKTNF